MDVISKMVIAAVTIGACVILIKYSSQGDTLCDGLLTMLHLLNTGGCGR